MMVRKAILILCCLFILQEIVIAQDSIQARIVLIGDAGQLTNGKQPVVAAVKRHIKMDKKTTVIFLGDNLYNTGLPDNSLPTFETAKAPLDSQIQIAGTSKAKVYFVTGNHDWGGGGAAGFEAVIRVQSYIDFLATENVSLLPRDGCPGPVEVSINDDITLIMMDSQWWLHEYNKPGIESDCPYKTKAEILVQLDDILSKNSKKLVLLAFHHTLRSYSIHGGYFTLKQHIFPFTDAFPNLYIPLPIIGSAYPLTRGVFGTAEDLKHPLYQAFIHAVDGVVKGHPNVIYIAGHDHCLQLIQDSGYNYITSGSGSKSSRVSKGKKSLYASPHNGFVTLDVSKNKNVQANFYVVDGDSVKMDYTNQVLDFKKILLPPADTTRHPDYKFRDSVVISASDRYKANAGFRRTFLGSNYRKEWATPITMQEFNIRKEKGGLTIKSLGGGKQTKSLQLTDKNGIEWTLRSVDKDPEKALPGNLRGTLAQGIVQDMISASHPYAPLVVAELAKATGIITPEPEFFFIPADPALGQYSAMFANTVAMLENRNPGEGFVDTKSTGKVLNKMLEDNEHHIDQEKVLNARLLDMLIGDFDRHADQWKWGTRDTGQGKLYYPIPKDRDQAFFNSNGLLIGYLSREKMRFLQGFKSRLKDINGLNYVARDFDRVFMNNLDEKDWDSITRHFQSMLTDEVIQKAVTKFPPPIAALDAKTVAGKLISRRDGLLKNAIRYYKFLSRSVSITGSNKAEYFHIKKSPNGKGLQLIVYKKVNSTDSASVMYNRVFDERITKELILYGLNGDDKFEIDDDVSTRINLRIIGGKGNDTFNLRGNIHNFVYDLSSEKNVSINLRRSNKEFSTSPAVNDYRSTGFEYTRTKFPQLDLGYNEEDKFLVGLGFSKRTYGFRKEPYASDQRLVTLYAPHQGAYQIKYDGAFNKIIAKQDLVIHSQLVNPSLNNFFGFGNESVFDKNKPLEFYRVRYKYFETDIMLRKSFNDIIQFSIGPSYYHYWSRYEDNQKRILGDPNIIGSDSLNIYGVKEFLGLKSKLDITYINNEIFPTRGITWFSEFTGLRGFNSNTNGLTKLTSDMTIYASVQDESRLSAVLRFGGGHIFSKGYEYFQALNLGANNYLRGFRKDRFSGSSSAYASAELRLKLFRSQSYFLPGDVGMMGFYDFGRVWERKQSSNKWHSSYGGGLYYLPYSLVMLSLTMGFSPEDHLFNFTLGTKFKLVF